jgi:hypothetical protein
MAEIDYGSNSGGSEGASGDKRPTKDEIAKMHFTDKNLYDAGKKPRAQDIGQDSLGDCFFIATLGAVAEHQPDRIKDMIKYDPKKDTFTVTLYQEKGGKMTPVSIEVTQAEIRDNIARGGGSRVDNGGDKYPVWPAIVETAYAKMNDPDPKKNGLNEGYQVLDKGGKAYNAIVTITGEKGENITNANVKKSGEDATFDKISKALESNRPVTLSTDPEQLFTVKQPKKILGIPLGMPTMDPTPQDGLADNHVYKVEKIFKEGGEIKVTLRNPWGSNNVKDESPPSGQDPKSPTITVKLKDIVEGGGFEYFNIGQDYHPKKVVGAAGAGAAAGASGGKDKADAPETSSATIGDPKLDALLSSMSDPERMKQTLQAVAAEAKQGAAPVAPEAAKTPQPEQDEVQARGAMRR